MPPSSPPVVAVIAQGAMGAGVGRRLTERGATVLTSLAGRSPRSAARAAEAGMRPVSDAEVAGADLVLSIVPPAEARALAERLAAGPTAAYRAVKTVLATAPTDTLEATLALEARLQTELGGTADHAEAVEAFLA